MRKLCHCRLPMKTWSICWIILIIQIAPIAPIMCLHYTYRSWSRWNLIYSCIKINTIKPLLKLRIWKSFRIQLKILVVLLLLVGVVSVWPVFLLERRINRMSLYPPLQRYLYHYNYHPWTTRCWKGLRIRMLSYPGNCWSYRGLMVSCSQMWIRCRFRVRWLNNRFKERTSRWCNWGRN